MRRFLKRWLKYFIFAGVFSMFINTLYLTFPLYMLVIYVRVLQGSNFSTLYAVTIGALTALLVLGLLDFLRSRLLVKAGVDMDQVLSRRVLKEMLLDSCRVNGLGYTQGLKDVNTLRNYFAGNAVFAFFDAPWVPIYLLVIYLMHPVLGMVATGGAVILLLFGVLQGVFTRKDLHQAQEENARDRDFIVRSLRNAEVVSSMGMESSMAGHWRRINDQEVWYQDRAGQKGQVLDSMSKSFRMLMQVIIFGAGATLVLMDQASTGIIIAASIIMGRALAPVEQGIGAWKQTVEARSAYKRLNSLLLSSREQENIRVSGIQGDLRVEEVGLDLGEKTVLQDISFHLPKGQILGLIGPNGAGKTSLCRMILGMWEPSRGQVLLDGTPAHRLDQDILGPFIGYLPQDVELFPGTVSENIARLQEVDSEKVVRAAKMACVHEVILRFPQGYETDIGESGQILSGGQRQRVGLARALYGDPSLVILDEPSSNLDEAGEQALAQALHNLREQGATVIMITHKPSLLAHVDRILALQQGRINLLGDRDEILKRLMREQPGGSASFGGPSA